MNFNKNTMLQFCNLKTEWKYKLVSSLEYDLKKGLLKDIGFYLSVSPEQIDFSLEPTYINDAVIAFSEQAKEHSTYESDLINQFVEQISCSSHKQSTEPIKLGCEISPESSCIQNNEVSSFKSTLSPPKRSYRSKKEKFNVRPPTQEQQQALDLCADGLVVNSFAGTGKTTLSGQVAEKLGYEKTLYTAFLKENASEAKERVTSRAYTQDSLAFNFVLKQSPFVSSFNPKLMNKQSEAGAVQILLGLPNKLDLGSKTVKYYVLSRLVQDTVFNFCNSLDTEIKTSHVPRSVFSDQAIKLITQWACRYWEYLISQRVHDKHIIKFPHLMKFWALRPDIQLPYEYENIIVDEAQDTNGAFYQVMQNHQDRNFVVIGDRHQQLFQWRGAVNTMNMFNLPKKSLTMSHRFGNSIAEMANNVLAKHSEPPKEFISGNESIKSKIIFYKPDEAFPSDVGAILTRTRTEIISIAKNQLELGHAISVKTEFNSIRFMCNNIIALANGKTEAIKHPLIARCYSISNLETELDSSPDGDVFFALKLYKKFGDEILKIIDQVERLNQPESESTRLISTTHALKGREWDTIVISSDYLYLTESLNVQLDEELCVLYVAITRAKKKAYIPYGLKKYFD